MNILGISAYYHDSAIAIISDEEILYAADEERFSRIKHDSSFPQRSLTQAFKETSLNPTDIDQIIFYEKPFIKFERLIETYLAFAPRGWNSFFLSMSNWLGEKIFQKKMLTKELLALGFSLDQCRKIKFSEHHLSHAASAFYPSPFKEALVLTVDGVGEWASTSVYYGKNNRLEKVKEIHFPHSLGLLYSAFTSYCGFKINSGEYKLMGLAPYGKPLYCDIIKEKIIDIKEDGSYRLNLEYFNFATGLTMTSEKFDQLFGYSKRPPESEILPVHFDIAASIQCVLEEILLKITRSLKAEYQINSLCLAGGVALNCVANGKILEEKIFDDIWVQPAAGDSGGALGAALLYYYQGLKKERTINEADDRMNGSFLGPRYQPLEIEAILKEQGYIFHKFSSSELAQIVAQKLDEQNIVGWFQGKMEYGPRSLGNRSILADARNPEMQKNLNLKTKFRESFRPFAPAILEEDLHHYFNIECSRSPYMLFTGKVKETYLNPKHIPAVTHVDHSARIQTVSTKTNSIFYELIKEFKKLTGTPILINTSFNIRGEPIVCSPLDALNCFMSTGIDILVLESYLLYKNEQPMHLNKNTAQFLNSFPLD